MNNQVKPLSLWVWSLHSFWMHHTQKSQLYFSPPFYLEKQIGKQIKITKGFKKINIQSSPHIKLHKNILLHLIKFSVQWLFCHDLCLKHSGYMEYNLMYYLKIQLYMLYTQKFCYFNHWKNWNTWQHFIWLSNSYLILN